MLKQNKYCFKCHQWFIPEGIGRGYALYNKDIVCYSCVTHIEYLRMSTYQEYKLYVEGDTATDSNFLISNRIKTIKFEVVKIFKFSVKGPLDYDINAFKIWYELYFLDIHGYLWSGIVRRDKIPDWYLFKNVAQRVNYEKKENKIPKSFFEVNQIVEMTFPNGNKKNVKIKGYSNFLRCFLVENDLNQTLRVSRKYLRAIK